MASTLKRPWLKQAIMKSAAKLSGIVQITEVNIGVSAGVTTRSLKCGRDAFFFELCLYFSLILYNYPSFFYLFIYK
jgi:hypothetical protein